MLDWKVSELTKSVDFLDLTITINDDGFVETRTYQKEMNLYLYIPPSSAHPPGCFKGLIFGNLLTYWQQNSHREDFIAIARSFAQRLTARGYSEKMVHDLFTEAGARIDAFRRAHCTDGTASETLVANTLDTLIQSRTSRSPAIQTILNAFAAFG